VYTAVCGKVVITFNSCTETLAESLMTVSFLYHCTVGVGRPSALHVIVKFSPTVVKYEDPLVMLIIGGSVENKKHRVIYRQYNDCKCTMPVLEVLSSNTDHLHNIVM